ncbi:sigma-70 family RNA polymerase sigma factor [Streptomyces sp. R35]|uniref:Sigma-70 family RNA polymerase sigma factor n=1 Tax=Streptomyces sp. R35 TaxID=3238630 RepID=A0AB39S4G0_9ACTN
MSTGFLIALLVVVVLIAGLLAVKLPVGEGASGLRRRFGPEIAAYTGLTETEVRLGQEALESFTLLSVDAGPVRHEDGRALADTLGEVEPGLDWIVNREALRPLLQAMPEREQKIPYMRFLREMTQRTIAEQFGISQMHVSRLISGTCARLRDQGMAEADGLRKAS